MCMIKTKSNNSKLIQNEIVTTLTLYMKKTVYGTDQFSPYM